MEHIPSYLGGGALAFLIIKEVFSFLKSKKPNSKDIQLQVNKLFNYHDKCPITKIEEKTLNNEKEIEALKLKNIKTDETMLDIEKKLSSIETKLDILLDGRG